MDFFEGSEKVLSGSFEHGFEILPKLKTKRVLLGVKTPDKTYDLHMKLPPDVGQKAELIFADSREGLDLIRHTTAHVLAQAVKELYPDTQVTIGPVIDNGFYYDFARAEPFKLEDLPAIEKKMKKILGSALKLKREEWPVKKAIEFFEGLGEKYKAELIRDLVKNEGVSEVSIYQQGNFIDLCRGPHVVHTGQIPAIKLMSVAGAYWRGDEKNAMLSRVYGTAFHSDEELNKYIFQIEEAKKRDHRKVGVEMDLFSFHDVAPASPFFHQNGAFLYEGIRNVLDELNKRYGFQSVISPLIMNEKLWHISGHYDNYKENMYFSKIDEQNYAVKPMNCPGHCLIYGTHRHSYKELPIRLAEFGRVHRYERSGVVNGLFRVRSFVQDDAHVYCMESQIEEEIHRVLQMIRIFYSVFDFKYAIELSTRPEKRIGSDETWDKAEQALKNALEKAGETYKVNPGDGAFYGPKIDFHLRDSLDRTHQCGTVQLDFSMPARFELSYAGSDNVMHTPVMIHRAIAGSLERFLGILIEHYAGQFPLWLCPTQVLIINVMEDAAPYAKKVFDELKGRGYRATLDDSNDKLSAKIKKHHKHRIPYMIILGAEEAQNNTISVRKRDGSQDKGLTLESFLASIKDESQPKLS
jgi:threonyl-tRNA synthetase